MCPREQQRRTESGSKVSSLLSVPGSPNQLPKALCPPNCRAGAVGTVNGIQFMAGAAILAATRPSMSQSFDIFWRKNCWRREMQSSSDSES